MFNLRGDDGAATGGLAVDTNLGWKGAEKYVATVPQVFDLWQDPQERYDLFMHRSHHDLEYERSRRSGRCSERKASRCRCPPGINLGRGRTAPQVVSPESHPELEGAMNADLPRPRRRGPYAAAMP